MIINTYKTARRRILNLPRTTPANDILPAVIYIRLYPNPFVFYVDFGADQLATQVPTGNGYVRDTAVAADTLFGEYPPIERILLGANGAAIRCASIAWIGRGSSFSAAHAVITYATGVDVFDLYHLDFEGLVTWPVGQLYGLTFDAEGLITYKAT